MSFNKLLNESMSDTLDLKKHIRNVDDFPIPGIKFRDITSLIESPEPFRKTCKELTQAGRKHVGILYGLTGNPTQDG